jgi:hypothetical protein
MPPSFTGLGNKIGRMAWAMMAYGKNYQTPLLAADQRGRKGHLIEYPTQAGQPVWRDNPHTKKL